MADSPTGTIGPVTWGSNAVNGQLVPQAPSSAFFPRPLGSQARGPGYWPRQGSWQVPPVVPNPANRSQMSPNAGVNYPTQATQSGNPYHPTQSPVLFGFLALVIGLFMLRYIHYGKG